MEAKQNMQTVVEQRVDTLENVLERFITSTNRALLRMENGIRDLKSELEIEAKRLDQKIAEQDKRFKEDMDVKDDKFRKEMKAEADRMNKKWGDLANKMGTLVEDIVAPSIKRAAFELFGFKRIDFFGVRVEKTKLNDRGIQKEFDVIVVGEDKVILNETKSKPSSEYVKEFIDFIKKEEFYDYFPDYKEKKLIPVFSTLYMTADVLKRLTKKRILAMGMSDSVMTVLNYDECRFRGLRPKRK